MPISRSGWEILIVRTGTQRRRSDGKVRTIGTYQVYHDGRPVPGLAGMTAESRGPGSNTRKGRRIAQGHYPLATQAGGKYSTLNYTKNANPAALRRPGIELLGTGLRAEILIHPGIGFLSSIGCINLCTSLPNAATPISFDGSRRRVIALIEDMKAFLGGGFPARDGLPIPGAAAIVAGEP
jgi:hypothetical protein